MSTYIKTETVWKVKTISERILLPACKEENALSLLKKKNYGTFLLMFSACHEQLYGQYVTHSHERGLTPVNHFTSLQTHLYLLLSLCVRACMCACVHTRVSTFHAFLTLSGVLLVCPWVFVTSGWLYEQLCEQEHFEMLHVNEIQCHIHTVIIIISLGPTSITGKQVRDNHCRWLRPPLDSHTSTDRNFWIWYDRGVIQIRNYTAFSNCTNTSKMIKLM